MECATVNPALSLLMKHLVIGQRQKAPYFPAFHWSPYGSLVSIGQHFVDWTGMDFASSTRAAENRTRSKGIVANSSVVPRQPSEVME